MLPLPLQFIIAMVAYAINERMGRRIEYLLEEVRVLREVYTETTGRKRIPFTDEQRRRLAIKGKALCPNPLASPSRCIPGRPQLAVSALLLARDAELSSLGTTTPRPDPSMPPEESCIHAIRSIESPNLATSTCGCPQP